MVNTHTLRFKFLASVFAALCLYQSAAVLQSGGVIDASLLGYLGY